MGTAMRVTALIGKPIGKVSGHAAGYNLND
jgi:hypothetical protein